MCLLLWGDFWKYPGEKLVVTGTNHVLGELGHVCVLVLLGALSRAYQSFWVGEHMGLGTELRDHLMPESRWQNSPTSRTCRPQGFLLPCHPWECGWPPPPSYSSDLSDDASLIPKHPEGNTDCGATSSSSL